MSDVIAFPKRRPEPENLLSAAELAKRWRRSRDWVYRLPAEELPFVRLGTRRRYRLADVLAYEERQTERGTL